MFKAFEIILPNKKSFVIISHRSYSGLIGFVEYVSDPDNTYIRLLSFWEFVKFIFRKNKGSDNNV